MIKESEKVLERKLKTAVETIGGLCVKFPAFHIAGFPDRICFLPGGRTVFAEIKTTGKKPTKIQKLRHEKLRNLGFKVEVIDSSEKILNFITECS